MHPLHLNFLVAGWPAECAEIREASVGYEEGGVFCAQKHSFPNLNHWDDAGHCG